MICFNKEAQIRASRMCSLIFCFKVLQEEKLLYPPLGLGPSSVRFAFDQHRVNTFVWSRSRSEKSWSIMKVVWVGLARVTEQARHNIVGNAIGLSFYSKKERKKERKKAFFLCIWSSTYRTSCKSWRSTDASINSRCNVCMVPDLF